MQHTAPVSAVTWAPTLNVLMTGSWDKTVSFWNVAAPAAAGAAPQPVHTMQVSERVYSADANAAGIAVVATADRLFSIYSLQAAGVQVRCFRV